MCAAQGGEARCLEYFWQEFTTWPPGGRVQAVGGTDKGSSQSACSCMGSLTSFEDGDPGTQMFTEHPSSTIPTVDLAGRGFAAAAFGSSCALWIPAMASSASGEPLGDSRGVPIPSLGVPFADIAPK